MGRTGEVNLMDRGPSSVRLLWEEPVCKISASLLSYKITIYSDWTREPAIRFDIAVPCLVKQSANSVSLLLNNVTCNNTKLDSCLHSCSPYRIDVLPIYNLSSANNEASNSRTALVNTLPSNASETSVVDFRVVDEGTRWFVLSWKRPWCRIQVIGWIVSLLYGGRNDSIPVDRLDYDNATDYFSFNVTDTLPCCTYTVGIEAQFVDPYLSVAKSFLSVSTDMERECASSLFMPVK